MSVPVSDVLTFAIVMAAGQFSPGPDMLLILKNSIAHRRAAALCTVLGTTSGIIIHTSLVITGLATFTAQYPQLLQIIWLGGACYLAWMGGRLLVGAWRSPKNESQIDGSTIDATTSQSPCKTAFLQGFITNITNPKVFIFFTGMLTTFLPPESDHHRRLVFGAILISEALVLWSLFVLLIQWAPVSRLYAKSVLWIDSVFGILLLWVAGTVFWQYLDLT